MRTHGHHYPAVLIILIAAFFLSAVAWNPALPVGNAHAQAQNHQEHGQEGHADVEHHGSIEHKAHESTGAPKMLTGSRKSRWST